MHPRVYATNKPSQEASRPVQLWSVTAGLSAELHLVTHPGDHSSNQRHGNSPRSRLRVSSEGGEVARSGFMQQFPLLWSNPVRD